MNNPDDPDIIKSPLCQRVTHDGITVDVEIYRLETSNEWTLELIDTDWNSTVWVDPFPSDQAAWEAFQDGLQELGIRRLLEDERPQTLH